VVAVIFGDFGDSSAAGVDWRLREGDEGGVALCGCGGDGVEGGK
jgi:hypothetical protein